MLNAQNRILIAKWTVDQDPCVDPPATVCWKDGNPATINDYVVHSIDTHHLSVDENGCMKCEMHPDIVVDLSWDKFAASWAVSGEGIEPFALQLSDQDATDAEIIGELYLFPVVYKAIIHRE